MLICFFMRNRMQPSSILLASRLRPYILLRGDRVNTAQLLMAVNRNDTPYTIVYSSGV